MEVGVLALFDDRSPRSWVVFELEIEEWEEIEGTRELLWFKEICCELSFIWRVCERFYGTLDLPFPRSFCIALQRLQAVLGAGSLQCP
jgi:hypothetical protein